MTRKALSPKQGRILQFIRKFIDARGYPPTVRDIVSGCKISSTSVVAYNLARLETAGYIRRHADISRGIELVANRPSNRHTVTIPVIGEIAAGEPIPVPHSDTWETVAPEELVITEDLTRGKQRVYALRVRGNSMIDALIKDGDIVLMEYVTNAENGDMVAAWLKAEKEVTLKRLFRETNRIRLEPANTQMQPIYTAPDNVEVQGKVITVIRQLV
ncbi:MAG: transcriptional repressor LexA [Dehalococcoidia bacterium]|jgi:repressor LexA|nr:transcriptional repressor LexA [Dehalococcoidia bacterium]